ncbi:MAG: hypothetical protein P4L44_00070 [Oryzomonas sp.]|uniref:hypothetical protein n=1 Tax=Oryzomonas sp. TaxID=2855186 RepID=UPI0028410037|nr:hypothetical protein [Oryzomonas sp.]MDR3578340.1 hypothetical protein [Oryzomonas sp.]
MKLTHLLVVLACGMAVLASCQGGTGSGQGAAQGGIVNRARFASLSTGYGTFINFTGSDSNGLKYTGSTQTFVNGPVIFSNGSSAIEKTSTLTITLNKMGDTPALSPYFYGYTAPVTYTLTYVAKYFYHPDKTLYKVFYTPSGLSATPVNNFSYPANLTFQNVTSGLALHYSNGNSWTSTWGVTDNGGGTEQFQVTWFNNGALSEIDTYIINSSGIILGYNGLLQNFPTPGVTTTFSSY